MGKGACRATSQLEYWIMNKTWLRTLETELDGVQLDRHGEGGRCVVWVRMGEVVEWVEQNAKLQL